MSDGEWFMKIRGLMVFVFLSVLISGCMATRFSNVWKDPSYEKGPVKSILVVAILRTPERTKMVEEEMARQLRSHGVSAVLSCVEFEGKEPSKDFIMSQCGRLGVEAVLVTRLEGLQYKSRDTYPDSFGAVTQGWEEPQQTAPAPPSGQVPSQYAPAALSGDLPQNYALMRTSLYDAQSRKMIWSVATETWIVGADSALTRSFVSTVLEKLADDKFIK
jgi:hypothetical protein